MKRLLKGATLYGQFIKAEKMPAFCRQHLDNGHFPAWERKILEFILDFLDPAETILQKSSGTTGVSKEMEISKEAMIRSAMLTTAALDLQKNQLALLCLPVDYIAGKMMIVRALVTGMNLVWIEPSALPVVPAKDAVDFCAMVPLQVVNLLERRYDFSYIKTLIVGGSSISAGLENQIKTLPCHIYETFGMAETCSHIALRRINGPYAKSWFTVLPGIKISTDDRRCLVIRAPFLPFPVVTNDVVEITGKRTFHWKGRFDHVINSGGIKINPEELEKTIVAVLGHELVVVGCPDDKLGQKPVMVTTHPYSEAEKLLTLKKLKTILPAYHAPADIISMDSMPRNRAFKINRKKLSETLAEKMKKNR
jgi:O-succinylbenzoic acid--CoA ligase